ncbi:MAG: prolipoprotein diacylglyceryl transferase [Lentisphaeria bacterium]|nr:prolipoprotein diacylglyceryl transferase [Lentisphaeria bacterium]
MNPIVFEIGGFSLRWYGVMAALGFLAATWAVNANRKTAGLDSDRTAGVMITAMVAGIVGARIFYVCRFFDYFRDNLWMIVRVDRGGLVFFGGFFCAIIALWCYCRYWKIDFIRLLDLISPALAIGHAFGRLGCFLNGCCFGAPSGRFPGISHPAGTEPFARYGNVPLHPVQLYEAAFNILLFVLLFRLVRRSKRGVVVSCYFIGYGIIRFADEFFRGESNRWIGLTQSQWIGLCLIPVGLLMLLWFQRRPQVADD